MISESLRSKRIDLAYHFEICQHLFPRFAAGSFSEAAMPRVAAVNNRFGGWRYAGSNTVFTNGGRDPWQALGMAMVSGGYDLATCCYNCIPLII
jgi:hypothetical protein